MLGVRAAKNRMKVMCGAYYSMLCASFVLCNVDQMAMSMALALSSNMCVLLGFFFAFD